MCTHTHRCVTFTVHTQAFASQSHSVHTQHKSHAHTEELASLPAAMGDNLLAVAAQCRKAVQSHIRHGGGVLGGGDAVYVKDLTGTIVRCVWITKSHEKHYKHHHKNTTKNTTQPCTPHIPIPQHRWHTLYP